MATPTPHPLPPPPHPPPPTGGGVGVGGWGGVGCGSRHLARTTFDKNRKNKNSFKETRLGTNKNWKTTKQMKTSKIIHARLETTIKETNNLVCTQRRMIFWA